VDVCAACAGARRRDDAELGNPLAAALEAAMLGGKKGKGAKKNVGAQEQQQQQQQQQPRAYAAPPPPAAFDDSMAAAFPPLPAGAPRRPRPGNVWTHAGGGAPALRQGAKAKR